MQRTLLSIMLESSSSSSSRPNNHGLFFVMFMYLFILSENLDKLDMISTKKCHNCGNDRAVAVLADFQFAKIAAHSSEFYICSCNTLHRIYRSLIINCTDALFFCCYDNIHR